MVAFINSYTNGALGNAAYLNTITAAEQFIPSNWTDSITIRVTWDAKALGQNGTLASNSFGLVEGISYASLKNALAAHAHNSDAQTAVATLPVADPSGGIGWALPVAYARFLGLTSSAPATDDTVTLNTSYGWSYGGDVIATLEHELTEGGMGRIGALGKNTDNQGHVLWSTMDLFRYSSAQVRDYTDGQDGKTTYFSVDGNTLLLPYNNQYNGATRVNNGDTADFNVLDPFGFGNPGTSLSFSATDYKVMNVLGFTPVTIGPPILSAAGDFNNNGNPDFVWRRTSDAQMSMWEYNPTTQTVSNTSLGTIPSTWAILGSAHFSSANGASAGSTQMLMDYVPNGTMTLWWVSNGALTGINLGQNWPNIGFLSAGQFTNNGGANITNFLVANAVDHHIYDWWVSPQNQLTGFDITATSGVPWANVSLVTVGQFTANGGTNLLVSNNIDHHLYDWWIGSNNTLGGIDLGPYWSNVSIVTTGQFTANGGPNLLVSNNIDHHLYDWWIGSNNTLQGIDLGSVWAGVQLVTVGRFDNNTTNTQMLVQNTSDHHLYEWWITPQGQLTGIDLGAVWSNVQLIGNSHYNNNSAFNELLVRNTVDGHFYEWWIANSQLRGGDLGAVATSATVADNSSSAIDASVPATSADSIPLLVQTMASFGAGAALVDSTRALAGIDSSQQSALAAASDPHVARSA